MFKGGWLWERDKSSGCDWAGGFPGKLTKGCKGCPRGWVHFQVKWVSASAWLAATHRVDRWFTLISSRLSLDPSDNQLQPPPRLAGLQQRFAHPLHMILWERTPLEKRSSSNFFFRFRIQTDKFFQSTNRFAGSHAFVFFIIIKKMNYQIISWEKYV